MLKIVINILLIALGVIMFASLMNLIQSVNFDALRSIGITILIVVDAVFLLWFNKR